jgi:hypothetical protein
MKILDIVMGIAFLGLLFFAYKNVGESISAEAAAPIECESEYCTQRAILKELRAIHQDVYRICLNKAGHYSGECN